MRKAKFQQVSNEHIGHFVAKQANEFYLSKDQTGILVESTATRDLLDRTLWTYKSLSFVPHGTELDISAELQPIYITTVETFPNRPNVIMCVNCSPQFTDYSNLCLIFSDMNINLNQIRQYYVSLKQKQYQLDYQKLSI